MSPVLQDALAVFLLSVGQYLTWKRVGRVERAVKREAPLDVDAPE